MRIILLVLLFWSHWAFAQSTSLGVQIPNSPQGYQSDRIRAGDIECQSAIGSSTNLEFGVIGIVNQNDPYANSVYNSFSTNVTNDPMLFPNDRYTDVGVYAKITIPIGAPKERLNCNTLYQLELERRRLEITRLKQEIENLKQLQFEQ